MEQADKSQRPPAAAVAVQPGDALEFELTDIDDARRVLDEESISQFDVAAAASEAQWKRVRRRSLPTDRALTGRAIDWIHSLPPGLHPRQLGLQFPRIVNQLAEAWDDPAGLREALGRLLGDARKGRKGFPRDVHDELVALRDWTEPF